MIRSVAPKMIALIALLAFGTVLINCGGNSSSITGPPVPNIAGSWEFIAVSNDGSVTGVEVALKEGSVQVNGIQEANGQLTASGAQIAFVSLDPTTLHATGFGGNCLPITADSSITAGVVTAPDAAMQFTLTENGNVFNVSGTLSGDTTTLLSGSYTPQSGNVCTDPGGTISGVMVPKISGTYSGTMCPPSTASCASSQDFTDTVTATASENSSAALTLNLTLTGTDNTNFTLTGPVTGNSFSLQGTFQGQTLTYYGYFEIVSNTQSLYLVNATNSASPNYVGTLPAQTQ